MAKLHSTQRTDHKLRKPDETPVVVPAARYDTTTLALHWIIAGAVIAQWLGAHAIDWFPRGPLRVDARSAHICLGVVLAGVLVFRLYWRMRRGWTFQGPERTVLDLAATVMQLALDGLLAAILLLGVFNTWLRGDSIMGWFSIPKFGDFAAAERHQFANQVVGLHRNAANLLLALAAMHALAAIAHHVVLKDEVLRRMTPRWALR